MASTCTHLETVEEVTPSSNGCEDCLRMGGRWVHLRLCMRCGHVGCCDNSPNRHATAHFRAHDDHPLIRSYEPREDWWWCYVDDLLFDVDGAPPAPSHSQKFDRTVPEAVIFDLDGVLLDSEPLWNNAKKQVVEGAGGRWRDDAPKAMIGMSSPEWSSYMRDELAVPLPPKQIDRLVVQKMEQLYRTDLPLLPGATDAVHALEGRWPLGLASSSNREVIDLVLVLAGLTDAFRTTVSSEEVAHGKPAPDVYLRAAQLLGVRPGRCVAIEDSTSGLRSASSAGMTVIAVPNPHYPPSPDALALAAVSVPTVAEVTLALVEPLAAPGPG